MSILEKYKNNSFYDVDKYHHKCPICNSNLYTISNSLNAVYDGNSVYHCDSHEEHVFYKGSRTSSADDNIQDILFLDKNATQTHGEAECVFKLVDGIWKKMSQLEEFVHYMTTYKNFVNIDHMIEKDKNILKRDGV